MSSTKTNQYKKPLETAKRDLAKAQEKLKALQQQVAELTAQIPQLQQAVISLSKLCGEDMPQMTAPPAPQPAAPPATPPAFAGTAELPQPKLPGGARIGTKAEMERLVAVDNSDVTKVRDGY